MYRREGKQCRRSELQHEREIKHYVSEQKIFIDSQNLSTISSTFKGSIIEFVSIVKLCFSFYPTYRTQKCRVTN